MSKFKFFPRLRAPAVKILLVSGLAVFAPSSIVLASSSIDLSKAANMGLAESFDEVAGAENTQEKNGLKYLPTGSQTFRGIPFQIIDSKQNQGRSFIVLKGRRKPDFPEGVSIPAGHLKASYLYFLHTCRWGGTAQNITVAEYDIVYDDGQITAVPLRVGVELTNYFNPDDTSVSFLAWWYKFKNIEMGVNLFPWKNPHPEKPIQSILFKSRGNMPVPMLFAITASDKELPISPVSPKPEKEFKTDTSKWLPYEPSGSSPSGTAIDMSFLLDAPAGKHGKVKADGDKLVFEDGTPARFWGVRLKNIPEDDSSMEMLANHLAAIGCNFVCFSFDESLKDQNGSKQQPFFFSKLGSKGIYSCLETCFLEPYEKNKMSLLSPDLTPQELVLIHPTNSPDLREVNKKLFPNPDKSTGSKVGTGWDISEDLIPPIVMNPGKNPFEFLAKRRSLNNPVLGLWDVFWPNEYLVESPLLFSTFAGFEGWAGSIGGSGDLINCPSLFIQWPTAALAYLRGDLKEGKVFVLDKDSSPLKILAHKSGLNPEGCKFKTDRSGELKAKVNEKTKSFVSDTGQITWQGNVGVVKVEAPRIQALIGFLSHRKFNNSSWAVETPNSFASLSAISLNNKAINVSDHILLTGVTRMENTGMIYNQTKTRLLNQGTAPILVEPLAAKIVLYRFQADPKLKIRALDANGQPLKTRVSARWVKNSFVFSWVPSAFYLEIFK